MESLLARLRTTLMTFIAAVVGSRRGHGGGSSPPPPTPVVNTVVVSPATFSVVAGSTRQLTAQSKDQFGANISDTHTWSSLAPGVATVNGSGLVTGVSAGIATIKATSVAVSAVNGTSGATVTALPLVTTVVLTPASFVVNAGATQQLTAQSYDQFGNTIADTFTWTTSFAGYATVNSSGLVTGVSAGSGTITATSVTDNTKSDGSPFTTTATGDFPVTVAASNYANDAAFRHQIRAPSSPPDSDYFYDPVGGASRAGTNTNNTPLFASAAYVDLITLDNTVLYNGQATFKEDLPANSAASVNLYYAFPASTPTLSKVWVRTKVRFGSGFTTHGNNASASGADSYKVGPDFGYSGTDGRIGIEITNTTQFVLTGGPQISGSSVSTPVEVQDGNIVNEWTDQNWYDYIVYIETLTTTTFRGRWWYALDGNSPTLKLTLNATMTGGNLCPPINRVAFTGLNYNRKRGASQNFTIWRGPTQIYDGTATPDPFGVL